MDNTISSRFLEAIVKFYSFSYNKKSPSQQKVSFIFLLPPVGSIEYCTYETNFLQLTHKIYDFHRHNCCKKKVSLNFFRSIPVEATAAIIANRIYLFRVLRQFRWEYNKEATAAAAAYKLLTYSFPRNLTFFFYLFY